jgi:hypothetical protein
MRRALQQAGFSPLAVLTPPPESLVTGTWTQTSPSRACLKYKPVFLLLQQDFDPVISSPPTVNPNVTFREARQL